MNGKYPAVLYACPCTDISESQFFGASQKVEEHKETLLNLDSPRANYNLYPLEYLLYCNECNEVRCPRCYFDEVVGYYCPGCTLETPSSIVKAESNRCSRNCFQCPVCIGPLALQSYAIANESGEKSGQSSSRDAPFILMCPYCTWSSLEVGITFEKSINISAQLAKFTNDSRGQGEETASDSEGNASSRDQFNDLSAFYRNQLSDSLPGPIPLTHGYGLDSPSQLSRLLSSYGVGGFNKQRGRSLISREADTMAEGLRIPSHGKKSELEIIQKMKTNGWQGTLGVEQRALQANSTRFLTDIRPIPMQLRSRRTKRCRTCRHILVKPEEKRSVSRYKIRLAALNFIPSIKVQPFNKSDVNLKDITRDKQSQYLLTLRNPLFDPIRVTLSTSRTLINAADSRVIVLCPQFEVGATKDIFEDALDDANRAKRLTQDLSTLGADSQQQAPEAGKIWDQGRNWTTIVLEVYPGTLKPASEIKVALLVRVEYETDESEAAGKSVKEKKVQKELGFWASITLGSVAEN